MKGGEAATGIEVGLGPPASVDAALRRMLRRRWWIWSVLALCYLVVMFHRIAPGVVADRLMADFSVDGAAVGALTSIYFWMYAVMQIPAGAFADSLGARRTVTIGASLAGLGSLIFGLAPALAVAYLGRFLVGLGVSVIFVAALKAQGNWFRAAEFGTMSGLLILVGNLGGLLATSPAAAMAQALGWRLSFVVVGGATCVLALAAWRWVRDSPAALGLPSPRGIDAVVEAGAASKAPVRVPFRTGARIVWGTRQTWAGFLAHFGVLGAYLTFTGLWAVPYLMHVYGMDRVQAASYLLVTTTGMIISAPLMGYVSDRFKRRRSPIVGLSLLACAVWLVLTLWNDGQPPVWALYPLFGALGFSSGLVTLILTCVKEANPPALSGLSMGTANNGFLCAALLQPAMGYLLDSHWQGAMDAGARVYPAVGYQAVLTVLTCFVLAGSVGSWMLKETYCRNVIEAG